MTCLDAALRYAADGWRVLPCHNVTDAGRCSCGDVDCKAVGKHPRLVNGVHGATTDVTMIRSWWSQWPEANVALACGVDSGIWALDVDPRHDGYRSLEEWEENFGPLPRTRTSITGSNGIHLLWKMPHDIQIRNRISWLPGIDVKADGGYILLPPSNHVQGMYRWQYTNEIIEAPLHLLGSVLGQDDGRRRDRLPDTNTLLDGIPEGQRDDHLFRFACRLRAQGFDYEHARTIILSSARNCSPPFPETEAVRKVQQAYSDQYIEADEVRAHALTQVHDCTDAGNALRLIDWFGNELRYVPEWGWLTWDGTRWQRLDIYAQRVALKVPEKIREHETQTEGLNDNDVERLTNWARTSDSAGRIDAMIKLARSDERVLCKVEDFDANIRMLNTPLGVVDLHSGELHGHRQEFLSTRCAGVGPGDYESKRWLEFLEQVQPDEEIRAYLKRAVGYSLTGSTEEKCMFILHGRGNNGKTVFLETVQWMLGDYAKAASKTIFVGRRDGMIPTDLADLSGTRFATCGEEIEQKDRVNSGFIKSLTGGDTMTARFMRKDYFTFTPQVKLWLGTNYRPGLTDFGDALKSRLRLIPWDVTIPRSQQRPRDELTRWLREEGEGIMRWALNGLLEWQSIGHLQSPTRIADAVDDWVEEEDIFGEFIRYTLHPPGHEDEQLYRTSDIHLHYKQWMISRGDDPRFAGSPVATGRELRARGYASGRDGRGQRCFYLAFI